MAAAHSYALDNALLLLEILRRIPRHRYTTSVHLHEQIAGAGYEVSLRTVQRHLDALCTRFPIECDTRGKPFGYRWIEGATGLNLPLLTPAEALLLRLSESEMSTLLPAKTLKNMTPLFASARRQLEDTPQPQMERRWLKKVKRIPENQPLLPPKIVAGVFEAISDALYRERQLFVRYRNAKGVRKEATLWPLGLILQGVRLYLVCRFEGYDNERILALPRILQAQVTEADFPWPNHFDLARYTEEGHFGISCGQRVNLQFRIEATLGQHLLESPLAIDQRVTIKDDQMEVVATVMETELLHRWLRGWGDKISGVKLTPIKEILSR